MGDPFSTRPSAIVSSVEQPTQNDPAGARFRIEDIYPIVDCGRAAVKGIAGQPITVWADIFRDGHDEMAAAVRWRRTSSRRWNRSPMRFHSNDRWSGSFTPAEPGSYVFDIQAWTDAFGSWRKATLLKKNAGQDVSVDLKEGLTLIEEMMPSDQNAREVIERALSEAGQSGNPNTLTGDEVAAAMAQSETRQDATRSVPVPLLIERERAGFSAWYEMVPRSQGKVPGKHGTFNDCIARIPEIAALGFDVLYFTPIHPIGHTNRKGKNNSLKAAPGDPGSFYAIGDETGGHTAIHPELGTLDDFRRLVDTCKQHGMEVALDIAVQCSPDHPWLKQHPEWFKWRPDGSIRYAENPPKKYEDIVNPDFNCADRKGLWNALRDVILFWVEQGVEIFRIDNPHTKPFAFWEWMMAEVRKRNPNVIFLSEAFTRPKPMKALAKLGFSQSYSYFTWRTTKPELEAYLSEITGYPERAFFRPNFFVTTPDILPVQLQKGETWLFKSRAALAAILSSNYGIYNGFELIEHAPLAGREEYLNSEKYEIRTRDWDKPGNIKSYLAALNRIRRENPALQQTTNLRFLLADDGGVIGFLKESADGRNAVAGAIAIDGHPREFWLHFGDHSIGPERKPVRQIRNLITGEERWLEWGGTRLRLDPASDPALLFVCLT